MSMGVQVDSRSTGTVSVRGFWGSGSPVEVLTARGEGRSVPWTAGFEAQHGLICLQSAGIQAQEELICVRMAGCFSLPRTDNQPVPLPAGIPLRGGGACAGQPVVRGRRAGIAFYPVYRREVVRQGRQIFSGLAGLYLEPASVFRVTRFGGFGGRSDGPPEVLLRFRGSSYKEGFLRLCGDEGRR